MNETTGHVRRWPLFVALAAVVVAATVAVASVAGGDEPPVIRLASDGSAELAATARADTTMEAAPAYTVANDFELADSARFADGEATAYRLEPPDDLQAAVATLAGRLGLNADVDQSVFGEGAYQVGVDDGTGPSLWVGPMGDWTYNAPSGQSGIRCVEPLDGGGSTGSSGAADGAMAPAAPGDGAVAPAEPGDGADPAEPADGTEPADGVAPADGVEQQEPELLPNEGVVAPCEPASPPAGVPDDVEARAAAEHFLAGLELPGDIRVAEVHADEWGAWVTASVQVGEVDSDLHVSVGFGEDAVVTSASATLARPVEAGNYPTIDAQAAVERLKDRSAWPGAALGPQGGRVPLGDIAVDDGSDVTILPVPEPEGEPEPRTVRLVSAEPRVVLTLDADQTLWLLPGALFTDEDGIGWQVLTIEDEYLEVPAVPEPSPMPVEPVPDPGGKEPADVVDPEPGQAGGQEPGRQPDDQTVSPAVDAEELVEALVGSSEAEAVERIEGLGLVARVVVRDGESQIVTDDLRTDRINLHIDRGRVVEASVG